MLCSPDVSRGSIFPCFSKEKQIPVRMARRFRRKSEGARSKVHCFTTNYAKIIPGTFSPQALIAAAREFAYSASKKNRRTAYNDRLPESVVPRCGGPRIFVYGGFRHDRRGMGTAVRGRVRAFTLSASGAGSLDRVDPTLFFDDGVRRSRGTQPSLAGFQRI